MTLKYSVLFWLSTTCTLASAENAHFDQATGKLSIPIVEVDGQRYSSVILESDESGRFSLIDFAPLSELENQALTVLESANCMVAHPLTKLLAIDALQNNRDALCLINTRPSPTEGKFFTDYLYIKDKKPYLATDNTLAPLSGCCFKVIDEIQSIRALYEHGKIVFEWNIGDSISLYENYFLQIRLSDGALYGF